ncbi:MAG TPA: response regulator [Actinomycetota bacterium]|nr:response regulator [Actinomycetota bacterium]
MSSSITILLVEDDPSVRELLKVLLEVEGYEIVEAKDGLEGLEKAGELKPDLMILDLMMPEVDGERVILRLRSEPATRRLPVIVVSGRYEALDRCRDMIGDENVFAKPFEPVKLLKRVGTLVGHVPDS